jgi:hypothetical protein
MNSVAGRKPEERNRPGFWLTKPVLFMIGAAIIVAVVVSFAVIRSALPAWTSTARDAVAIVASLVLLRSAWLSLATRETLAALSQQTIEHMQDDLTAAAAGGKTKPEDAGEEGEDLLRTTASTFEQRLQGDLLPMIWRERRGYVIGGALLLSYLADSLYTAFTG